MSDGEVNKIVSNDYFDLLIEYDNNFNILNKFDSYTIINDRYAIVNVPNQENNNDIFRQYGWAALPKCFGLMDTSSLEASGVIRIQNIPALAFRGQGVLLGIIDSGIEYTNPVFQNADKTSRIISIWDQNIQTPNQSPADIPYGMVYTRDQINQALQSENPLELVPSTDEIGHGTMIAGVAAGSRIESADFVGVVPESELIVVKLKPAKPSLKQFFLIPENTVCYQSTDLMFGVRYLTDQAKSLNRPIVICIGLGTSTGAHDGRGALSAYLDFISDASGTAVVIAGGNEGNSGAHYSGAIDNKIGSDTVELKVGKDSNGFVGEIWGLAPNTFSVDILSPSGEYIPRIPIRIGEGQEIRFLFESTVLNIDYELTEKQTGMELILLRFRNPAEGIWKIRVYSQGTVTSNFNFWLPIQPFLDSEIFFLKPNPETTITSPGNGYLPITVTAYDHVSKNLYNNASRGYTVTNFVKPELAAPGVNVYAPGLNNTFTRATGTSAAAALTAGVAAMLLEWGIVKGNLPMMDTFQLKNLLIRGAQRDPSLSYPNKEWGYGILDIYNTYIAFRGE